MPKDLREYRIINDEKVEILYWVANLYGRHDAGRKFVTGHRQWFLERGFIATTAEPCIFKRTCAKGTAIVFAHTWMTVHGW